jgi:hypothetical protein
MTATELEKLANGEILIVLDKREAQFQKQVPIQCH